MEHDEFIETCVMEDGGFRTFTYQQLDNAQKRYVQLPPEARIDLSFLHDNLRVMEKQDNFPQLIAESEQALDNLLAQSKLLRKERSTRKHVAQDVVIDPEWVQNRLNGRPQPVGYIYS